MYYHGGREAKENIMYANGGYTHFPPGFSGGKIFLRANVKVQEVEGADSCLRNGSEFGHKSNRPNPPYD